MQTRTIGTTTVSAIGLGGMPLSIEGRPDDRSRAVATIHAALEAGITFIDTADAYHLDSSDVGHNELLIAEALSTYGGETTDVLVATKGGHTRPGGGWALDGSPGQLRSACDESLKRLGVEAIGLYQFHRPDPDVDYAESVGAIRDLLDAGKIRMAGVSNADPYQARAGDPRRPSRLGAEPVLPSVPVERARAAVVRRAGHRVPAVEPARRHLQGRRAGIDARGVR
jgi:aryl-alcohol dehydrogenase-like predicted oxidoreductase